MGIDAEIYFKSFGEPTDLYLPNHFDLCQICEPENYCGANYCISTVARYYGPHYERGPWPAICSILMSLFASTNVERVWYFGDYNNIDETHPITIKDVIDISHHYMLNGERPYREKAERITTPDLDKLINQLVYALQKAKQRVWDPYKGEMIYPIVEQAIESARAAGFRGE